MREEKVLAERFEAERVRLRSVAYRMLGTIAEAEDAVQEAWFKLSRSDVSEVKNLGAWLTTVVGRVCLDILRSRASRREDPLPEQDGWVRFVGAEVFGCGNRAVVGFRVRLRRSFRFGRQLFG